MLNLLLEGHFVEDVINLLRLDDRILGENLHGIELRSCLSEKLLGSERELREIHLRDGLARHHWTSFQWTVSRSR